MKIGYFADGPWGVQALNRILDDATFRVAFLVVRFRSPDQTLRTLAAERGLPLLEFSSVNAPEVIARLAEFGCDLFVSMSFDQIFRERIRQTAKLGIINCHAGDLPRYRGRNVINWALINGEERLIRAIKRPAPGARTGRGAETLRVWRSRYDAGAPLYLGAPGAVVETRGCSIVVKTGDSHLEILEWSREDGAAYPLRVGDRLGEE